LNRYNFIAPAYDFLKRIVFGNSLEKASHHHLPNPTDHLNILIVGGGTGKILEQFGPAHTVHYVDTSSVMIDKAKKRKVRCTVYFHHCEFDSFETDESFDLICFPFFLDQFNDGQIAIILSKSYNLLSPTGSVIITDFVPVYQLTNWWQKLLLKTVIVFFTITTKHPVSKIFNIVDPAKRSNFQLVKKKSFVNGMVIASLWKKAEH